MMPTDAASTQQIVTITFKQIEAIPDMIAALKECLWLLADIQPEPGLVQEKARKALAKAGEKP